MAIEIINGLYLGSKIDSHNPIFLSSRNIKVIINTTTEIPFLKDCENLGIQCIRVPISQNNENDEKSEKHNDEYYYQFRDLCKLIDLKLHQNKNILVHCSSGRTRASILILAYLMYKLRKIDKTEIYKLLATKYQMVPLEKNIFSTAIRKWDEEMKI
jgi:protein-tyrosine phosphatase